MPTVFLSLLLAAVSTEPVAETATTATPSIAAAEPHGERTSKAMTAVAAGAGAAAGTGIGLVIGVSTAWVLNAFLGVQGYGPYVAGAVLLVGGAAGGGLVGVVVVDRPDAMLGAAVGAAAGVIGGGLAGAMFGYANREGSLYELLAIGAVGGCIGGAALGAVVGVVIGAESDPPPL